MVNVEKCLVLFSYRDRFYDYKHNGNVMQGSAINGHRTGKVVGGLKS